MHLRHNRVKTKLRGIRARQPTWCMSRRTQPVQRRPASPASAQRCCTWPLLSRSSPWGPADPSYTGVRLPGLCILEDSPVCQAVFACGTVFASEISAKHCAWTGLGAKPGSWAEPTCKPPTAEQLIARYKGLSGFTYPIQTSSPTAQRLFDLVCHSWRTFVVCAYL